MNFREWQKFYQEIALDLDISQVDDYRASEILSGILGARSRISNLDQYIGLPANVYGNGPFLEKFMQDTPNGLEIVADSAITTYLKHRDAPDIIVTDLDGDIRSIMDCARTGSLVVVHAHGDNIERLEKFVPSIEGKVIGTTQNTPLWNVFNFFGFTDGDRSAYIADYLNSPEIRLIGFDFTIPGPKNNQDTERKIRKLKWAEKLLLRLASERGSNFVTGGLIRI